MRHLTSLSLALMIRVCMPNACGPKACRDYAYPLTATYKQEGQWLKVRHRGQGLLASFKADSVQSIRALRQ